MKDQSKVPLWEWPGLFWFVSIEAGDKSGYIRIGANVKVRVPEGICNSGPVTFDGGRASV